MIDCPYSLDIYSYDIEFKDEMKDYETEEEHELGGFIVHSDYQENKDLQAAKDE